MRLKARTLLLSFGVLIALLVGVAVILILLIQTRSFHDRLREKTVSILEDATGGRVQLGSVRFDWRTLTVVLDDLVVHGTEPADAAPLLTVPSVRIQLRILSVFRRSAQVTSIVVDQPNIDLRIRPDGVTNVPPSISHRFSNGNLLDVKVRRYAFTRGFLLVNDQRHAFNLQGEDLQAKLRYEAAEAKYDVQVYSRDVRVQAPCCAQFPVKMTLHLKLGKNIAEFENLNFASNRSSLSIRGTVSHFVSPRSNFSFTASLRAEEIAPIVRTEAVKSGDINLEGDAYYDTESGFSTHGKLGAQHLSYRSAKLSLPPIAFSSYFRISKDDLLLEDLHANILGGSFAGRAELIKLRSFTLDGELNSLKLQQLSSAISSAPLPWSGNVSGSFSAVADFKSSLENSALQTNVHIVPAAGGIPLSGDLSISKKRNTSEVSFGESDIELPHTKVRFSGSFQTGFQILADSSDLSELEPLLASNSGVKAFQLPDLLPGGDAHFAGTVAGTRRDPTLDGTLVLTRFRLAERTWDRFESLGRISSKTVDLSKVRADASFLHMTGKGSIELHNWRISGDSAVEVKANVTQSDLSAILSPFHLAADAKISGGTASGTVQLSGLVSQPSGNANLVLQDFNIYGQRLARLQAELQLSGNEVTITNGRLTRAPGELVAFSGLYRKSPASWQSGQLNAKLDSDGINVSQTSPAPWKATLESHATATAQIENGNIRPLQANGWLALRDFTVEGTDLGQISATVTTHDRQMNLAMNGDLRESKFSGIVNLTLLPGTPFKGQIRFNRTSLATLGSLVIPQQARRWSLGGFVQGGLDFAGELDRLQVMQAALDIDTLEIKSNPPASQLQDQLVLRNSGPILLDLSGGIAKIRRLQLTGTGTEFSASGSFGYLQPQPINMNLNGALNLQLLRFLNANVVAQGKSSVSLAIGGTLVAPTLSGRFAVQNGSLSFPGFPEDLTAVHGTVAFSNDRATIEQFTAQSGGGRISVGGFVSFGGTGPLVYGLDANADNVRIRYARSISVTADANLRLTGTSSSSLLSGNASVSRIVFNPNTDVGNVLANFAGPAASPDNPEDLLAGLQLDVSVQSAPNLQLSTELSRDVEAGIDLHVRGTPNRPVLLGAVSLNQGDVRVFGARYSINRGEIRFANTTRLEPILDLDLQTQARGIAIDITISGTLNKLNINYRSDPPLQPRDIIALLTVGRTPEAASNVQSVQAATADTNALQSGANTVLGQAISPPPSRLSKLFGITNIKIDPLVQGITNTPQSRLTLEQQISRSITVTYITNLAQTSEQIFRLEWALNRQYSVVAVRDDNGEFGIDIQYKKRFK